MIAFPNAKINLGLHITERRSDGYHTLETIFYPVELEDALEVVIDENIEGDYLFQNSGIIVDCNSENNIVIKALQLLRKEFQLPKISINLLKKIPFGGGLGGGSSDAAFMLKLLNKIAELNLSDSELAHYAVQIGADCPFFLYNKPMYATGIGEILTPIDISLKDYFLLLVKPDMTVSTAKAYSMVSPHKPWISLQEIIQMPVGQWRHFLKNDFEESVFSYYPEIGLIKEQLYAMGAEYAAMSGSGATLFGLFKNKPEIDNFNCFTHLIKLTK